MKQIYKTYTLKINTLLFFALLNVNVFAQTQKLTGLVQSNNENILGATVRTNDGISQSTDAQGAYTIDVTANTKSITVSYVGYKSVTKNITEAINNVLNFDLDATSLDEVVVVGSRAVPRSNLETPAPVDVIDIKNLTKDVAQVSLNQI